jgi:hypothetical protein
MEARQDNDSTTTNVDQSFFSTSEDTQTVVPSPGTFTITSLSNISQVLIHSCIARLYIATAHASDTITSVTNILDSDSASSSLTTPQPLDPEPQSTDY